MREGGNSGGRGAPASPGVRDRAGVTQSRTSQSCLQRRGQDQRLCARAPREKEEGGREEWSEKTDKHLTVQPPSALETKATHGRSYHERVTATHGPTLSISVAMALSLSSW